MPHVPPVHVACPFAGATHAFPHAPQLLGSLVTSAHVLPHSLAAVGGQVATQPSLPFVAVHLSFDPVQALPQVPQFAATVRSVSQPFSGLPSQSPKPVAQASAP